MDPFYKVRFSGSSVCGPLGDLPWGLDAEDTALTGNPVNLDTYLDATRSIKDFALASGIPTKVFLSTGPLRNECAGYPPFQEVGYQTFLKNDRIRQSAMNDPEAILFDFGDIVAHNDDNQIATTSFTSSLISVTYPTMHPDNMVNFDGSNVLTQGEDAADPDGDHIGNVGSVRIGKAAWVLMARLAGWNGRPEN